MHAWTQWLALYRMHPYPSTRTAAVTPSPFFRWKLTFSHRGSEGTHPPALPFSQSAGILHLWSYGRNSGQRSLWMLSMKRNSKQKPYLIEKAVWFALCGDAVSLQEACLLPSTLMAVGSVVVDTRHLNYAYRDTFTTKPSAPWVELTLVLLSSCYLCYAPKDGDRKPILRSWLHLAEETTKKCMQPTLLTDGKLGWRILHWAWGEPVRLLAYKTVPTSKAPLKHSVNSGTYHSVVALRSSIPSRFHP